MFPLKVPILKSRGRRVIDEAEFLSAFTFACLPLEIGGGGDERLGGVLAVSEGLIEGGVDFVGETEALGAQRFFELILVDRCAVSLKTGVVQSEPLRALFSLLKLTLYRAFGRADLWWWWLGSFGWLVGEWGGGLSWFDGLGGGGRC